ncbi:MAG TPA: hypothetical protein VIK69_00790 [Methylophilaceae bacterium]
MWCLYQLFRRHHIRPGEFWRLPFGEQQMLLAFLMQELEDEERQLKELDRLRGLRR